MTEASPDGPGLANGGTVDQTPATPFQVSEGRRVASSPAQGRSARLFGHLVVGAVGLVVFSGVIGCNPLTDGPSPFPTATVRPTATPNRAYSTVRVGTIIDAVKTLGRVVAAQEADLNFRNTGRIRDVFVQPGDLVNAGQVLAELDQRDLPWQLSRARLGVRQADARLEASIAREVIDTVQVDELAVKSSVVQLAGARLAQSRVDADIPDADILDVRSRIASARSALDSARFAIRAREADLAVKQAELALKLMPPPPQELTRARLDIEIARVRLAQAEAGPWAEEIRAAELLVDQEKTRMARLIDSPPVRAEDIAGARLDLLRAEGLVTRVFADIDAGVLVAPVPRASAIATARNGVDVARNALGKLLATVPSATEIEAQRSSVRLAEIALEKLKAPKTYDADAARVAVRMAEARLAQLRGGPNEAELASMRAQIAAFEFARDGARGAVAVAEANLQAAESRLAFILEGPNRFDRDDAANRVSAIQAQIAALSDRVDTNRQVAEQARTIATFDQETLRRAVAQARLDVSNFEDQTGDVRIAAPFSGRITRLAARPGDTVQAFFPVMNLSSLEGVVVKADISEADVPRLQEGMPVDLTMDIYPGQLIRGRIISLPVSTTERVGAAPDRATRIAVEWPPPTALGRPELGMLARVQITLLSKPDVLLVPNTAIKIVGKRKFIEYMDGDIRRSRNVELGIQTDTDTEVLSGVQPGMVVISGQN
ncbi:MAG: HlyD family efflux transporter periplasmic adaptor subunit [Chloroflexi bacterium]|nr:HlyD family efflux transporter periplasmic adaptor subunit [Chloroflexota bacterium]